MGTGSGAGIRRAPCGAVSQSAGDLLEKEVVESPELVMGVGGMSAVVSQGFLFVVCPQGPMELG